jgi:hypothetical protein
MNPADEKDARPAQPRWTQATPEDVRAIDLNGPVADLRCADSHDYSTAYSRAAEQIEKREGDAAASESRVFLMLGAVTGMHLRASDAKRPFGAQLTFSDGRRSAIPEDFRGAPLAALSDAAVLVQSPVIRARVSDVCWLLDRTQSHLGRAAITAYVDVVNGLEAGELHSLLKKEVNGAHCPEAQDAMGRALAIGRAIGWETHEALLARERLTRLRESAVAAKDCVPVLWFCELDLRLGVSEPGQIGAALETLSAAEEDAHHRLELCRLAARAYHNAEDEPSAHRCLIAASDCLVAQADAALKKQNSAMLAAHWLSMAIAQLHGVPGVRERSTALRHKLVDAQASIRDEMSAFSHPIDLREVIERVEKAIGSLALKDLLFFFASMDRSPDPAKLTEDARNAIQKHPLAAMFGSSHHDDEGKVVYRSGEGEDARDSTTKAQIMQAENIRRQLLVRGKIDVVRRNLSSRFYLSDDIFRALIQDSPFVPPDSVDTYSRGFSRFFEGDFTSAIYVLTPMLENSLRYVLRMHGHDVSKFDINDQTQQDRTISALFEQMRPELDAVFGEAITTDIDNVFLSQPGPTVRHVVAHGLLPDGAAFGHDCIYACWLLFRLCCIPLFEHRESIQLPV